MAELSIRSLSEVQHRTKTVYQYKLQMSIFLNQYRWIVYADPIAAMIIAIMILACASKIFRHSARDLLDYALEEHSQLLILRALVNHFDQYDNIQNVRTRAAGGKVYVEIFMEFDGSLKHSEVMKTAGSL